MKRKQIFIFLAACTLGLYASCTPAPATTSNSYGPATAEEYARRIAERLSLEELAAQTLIISAGYGTQLSEDWKAQLGRLKPGGVILLSYNIRQSSQTQEAERSAEKLRQLCTALQKTSTGIPLFIAIDHEGGSVNRLRNIAPPLPDAAISGAASDSVGLSDAQKYFDQAAQSLHQLGINMNFAPVLEPLLDENREFLSRRSYSQNPEVVYQFGISMIDAMLDAGVLPVAKHFPGSGNGDPHIGLPVFGFDPGRENETAVQAFRTAIQNHNLPALMSSHVLVPAIDPENPATVSSKIIGQLLREQMGFTGLLVTDDVYMQGLQDFCSPQEAAVLALSAGADMILAMGAHPESIRDSIVTAVQNGTLSRTRLEEAAIHIISWKLRIIPGWSSRNENSKTRKNSAKLISAKICIRFVKAHCVLPFSLG